jgi:hypothetical protein
MFEKWVLAPVKFDQCLESMSHYINRAFEFGLGGKSLARLGPAAGKGQPAAVDWANLEMKGRQNGDGMMDDGARQHPREQQCCHCH